MKRDLNLSREILLFLEAREEAGEIDSDDMVLVNRKNSEIAYHCALLSDDGLLLGHLTSDLDDASFYIQRLTARGHSYLDAIRTDTIWNKVIDKAKQHGGSLPLKIAEALALKYLEHSVFRGG